MTTIVATIFVLGIVIFVHEMGHFLTAKLSGIRVERFSFGFPPKMIGKKIGDTEYCISWIPLGGYVKMAGWDPTETSTEAKPYEFTSKPARIKALVIAGGPIMNLILPIFIFWGIIFFQGKHEVHGDSTKIGVVAAGEPADRAGIQSGDEITSVNGIPVSTFWDIAEIVYQHVEEPVEVKWKRNEEEFSAMITTFKDKLLDENGEVKIVGKIGIGPSYTTVRVGFFKAFIDALEMVWFVLVESVKFIIGLITGAVSLKLLVGPIYIAHTAGETAKSGFVSLLSLTALLSAGMSLVNLLPVPVLDGGHLVVLGIEKAKGSPLSLKQRVIMQQIGLVILIFLTIFVTYNDFIRVTQ